MYAETQSGKMTKRVRQRQDDDLKIIMKKKKLLQFLYFNPNCHASHLPLFLSVYLYAFLLSPTYFHMKAHF